MVTLPTEKVLEGGEGGRLDTGREWGGGGVGGVKR